MKLKLIMFSALMLIMAIGAQAATYTIDASHSSVEFKVRHMMVSNVRGNFEVFNGSIEFDESDLKSWSAQAEIDMASVNTSDTGRDEHLVNADFFDVETYPTMTFKSKSVEKAGDDYVLHGELTLHGVTKPVQLDLEFNGTVDDPWGNHRAGFSASGKIDRRDYGITWNNTLDKGGLAVGNDVKIMLEIEAIRQ
jgi:polyisoprenoid-binding protein YceI